ncbi:MAG TPA: metallophosphoesterase family protein [Pyrinomonadaceae bacterium]|jgi:serine/threonine protein phosphatase 1
MKKRTFAIGDIHGDMEHLRHLWSKLPDLTSGDTVVFLGDYVDRGPDSRGVVEFVRQLPLHTPARVVALMGNHEQILLDAYEHGKCDSLMPPSNGVSATYRSFKGEAVEGAVQFQQMLEVRGWLPADVFEWMKSLPRWYEDEYAIYVHAGLEGEGKVWFHPTKSDETTLLWMREPDFWTGYTGKRIVFGHTVTSYLPLDHLGFIEKVFDDKQDVWFRGDLIGIDTGCGKGGFLSAIELPSLNVYESR